MSTLRVCLVLLALVLEGPNSKYVQLVHLGISECKHVLHSTVLSIHTFHVCLVLVAAILKDPDNVK